MPINTQGDDAAPSRERQCGRFARPLTRAALLTVLMFAGVIALLPIAALLPGGIRVGSWTARAFTSQTIMISPEPPLFTIHGSRLRQRPAVWDPEGPEIQVGPELPWSEGSQWRLDAFGWRYWLRIELPSGRYQIAPPLP